MVLIFTGFDRLLGSHYDKYVITYEMFTTTINDSTFDVDFSDCKQFPGPGVNIPMAENHAFAFFGAAGYGTKHQSHKVDTEFDNFKEKHGRKYNDEKHEEQKKFHFRRNHR